MLNSLLCSIAEERQIQLLSGSTAEIKVKTQVNLGWGEMNLEACPSGPSHSSWQGATTEHSCPEMKSASFFEYDSVTFQTNNSPAPESFRRRLFYSGPYIKWLFHQILLQAPQPLKNITALDCLFFTSLIDSSVLPASAVARDSIAAPEGHRGWRWECSLRRRRRSGHRVRVQPPPDPSSEPAFSSSEVKRQNVSRSGHNLNQNTQIFGETPLLRTSWPIDRSRPTLNMLIESWYAT